VRVFVTRRLPVDPAEVLSEHDVEVWPEEGPPPAEVLREKAAGCDGLLTLLSDRVDGALFDAAPTLRVVANYAVGFDNIDVSAASERGIWVTHTPGVLTDATADLAFTLLLAVARRLPAAEALARTGDFGHWSPTAFLGLELAEARLGILGFGAIGRAVARRARGFGMEVRYHSRSPVPESDREGAEPMSWDALLESSDVLSIHAPLTDQTRGLVDGATLGRMKKGALLINTARGPIVDEGALAEALASGHLGGAGLDVFEDEPRVHPALLERRDVVLTPHVGSATTAARRRMALTALRNVAAVLGGNEPPDPIPGSRPPT
jgi:glyoxylate reductase